ncbi:MAG: 7-cyano-7-deazaguanine synthase QueC [Methanoregulaceae archaeon]|nr:7-cyano-7-deazaguanine synthase QueC [Methanoregulaceae archaeon]MCU0629077.1 7-cyano-7-deazaguanine synthase QueC [Methanoregulaceae archaeon]
MKAVCLLSGGMDSATLAYLARDQGYHIYCLHFNYGQRTERKEQASAKKIAGLLGARELIEIDLSYLTRFGGSSLTDHNLSVDRYQEDREGIPNTYVPFRNANLLSIATSYAEARGADAIFIGVQSQDYSGYPDCRPQFIDTFQRLVDVGTRDETCIRINAPFLSMTKKDILIIGVHLKVPYEHTWSCYQNEEKACGVCGACHFRKAAFESLGLCDPVPYEED